MTDKESFNSRFPETRTLTFVKGDKDYESKYYREDLVKELLETIDNLRTGSCWCEGGRHSTTCIKTQELMKKWRDVYEYDEEGKENDIGKRSSKENQGKNKKGNS